MPREGNVLCQEGMSLYSDGRGLHSEGRGLCSGRTNISCIDVYARAGSLPHSLGCLPQPRDKACDKGATP